MSAQSDMAQPVSGDSDSSGPNTVRILPEEDVPTRLMDPDDPDLHPVQKGTLYTPAPQAQIQAYTPPDSAQSRQIAIEPIEPEGGRLARSGGSAPPAANQPVIIKKGPSTCAIVAGIGAFLIISCAVLAFAGINEGFNKLFGWIPNPFGPQKTEIDVSKPTIIESIRGVSELSTVKYHMEKIVVGKSTGPLPDWLVSDKLVLIAYGEVAAGIDLSEIKETDICDSRNRCGDEAVITDTVKIKLPASKIIYSKLDNGKTQVFQRDTTIFTRADPNLETAVRAEAEKQMVEGATENGILKQAQTNTEGVLRTLLTGLGYKNIQFVQTSP